MKGRNLLGLAFRIIGLGFAVIAAVVGVYTLIFVLQSETVTGTIAGHARIQNKITVMPESDTTGVLYYPVIEYRAPDGQSREFTAPRGTAHVRFEVGDQVPVLVSVSNPARVRLATLLGTWGTAIVLAGIAVIFLLIGFVAPLGFGGLRR